jgi:hypothetical protein
MKHSPDHLVISKEASEMKTARMMMPLAILLGFSLVASAGSVTLNMQGLQSDEAINTYFNGGFGGNGSGPGPSDGIVFSSNSLALISRLQGGSGNFQSNPSGGPIAFFESGTADTMDVAAGFTTGFSFYYSSADIGSVDVYSGLDGTGTLLASVPLVAQYDVGCSADASTSWCNWSAVGVTFSGTAESVNFGGAVGEVAFDSITLGASDPGTSGQSSVTPEPSSLVLFGSGLLGLVGAVRRKFAK